MASSSENSSSSQKTQKLCSFVCKDNKGCKNYKIKNGKFCSQHSKLDKEISDVSDSNDSSTEEKCTYICTSICINGKKCTSPAIKNNKLFCMCHNSAKVQKKNWRDSIERNGK